VASFAAVVGGAVPVALSVGVARCRVLVLDLARHAAAGLGEEAPRDAGAVLVAAGLGRAVECVVAAALV
jgi:hypothetical protein